MYTKQLPTSLGCTFRGVQLSGGVLKLFFPFHPSVNFAKFHLGLHVPPSRLP